MVQTEPTTLDCWTRWDFSHLTQHLKSETLTTTPSTCCLQHPGLLLHCSLYVFSVSRQALFHLLDIGWDPHPGSVCSHLLSLNILGHSLFSPRFHVPLVRWWLPKLCLQSHLAPELPGEDPVAYKISLYMDLLQVSQILEVWNQTPFLLQFWHQFPCAFSHHQAIPQHKMHVLQDYSGGIVDKNPAANAGDMSSIPGPGRSHILRDN